MTNKIHFIAHRGETFDAPKNPLAAGSGLFTLIALIVLGLGSCQSNDPKFDDVPEKDKGGFLTLVNGTDTDWVLSDQCPGDESTWNFPERVESGKSTDVYLVLESMRSRLPELNSASVNYQLEGVPNSEFQIAVNQSREADLRVSFISLQSLNHGAGSFGDLGWKKQGYVSFILVGKGGKYFTNLDITENWMSSHLDLLGYKPLKDICIPGSHNSGMSEYSSGTAFTGKCNTLCQYHGVLDQLKLGVRYFDIRPALHNGKYATNHYTKIESKGVVSWQGAIGQSMESIIDDLNSFTEKTSELIIINLSHSLNTDLEQSSIRKFTSDKWMELMHKLQRINNLYQIPFDSSIDLANIPLNEFLLSGSAVVLIMDELDSLGEFEGKGFFLKDNLNVYDKYANSNDVLVMAGDQLGKLEKESSERYFLLSWTLTQNNTQATSCFSGLAASIEDLALQANQRLPSLLFPSISSSAIPNVIYLDFIDNQDVTTISLALSFRK